METTRDTVTTPRPGWRPGSESLRLIVALYGMGAAIGLWPMPGLGNFLQDNPHQEPLASLWSVAIFSLSWMIMVGLHLRAAALVLMGLVLFASSLFAAPGPVEFVLVAALALIAGLIRPHRPEQSRQSAKPGRIRLRRIKAAAPARSTCATKGHPFLQSPDELGCLFDQIAESR